MFGTMTDDQKLAVANVYGIQNLIEVVERACYWVGIARELTRPYWASPATGDIFNAIETLCEGLKAFKKEYTS